MDETILFVYRNFSSFVKNDFEILKKNYKVVPLHATKNILKSILKLIWNIRKVDLIFIWFGGWHAFLPILFAKTFRKKSIVVAGGYDAAYVPEINYGVFTSWWRGIIGKWVFDNVDMVLAVSKNTKKEVLEHSNPKCIKLLYNGVDTTKFVPKREKKRIIITVGKINRSNLKKKGFSTFVRTAKYLPNNEFILIGNSEDDSIEYLMSIATENVKFTGYIPFEDLLDYYQRAKVYVQISGHESFGIALAEAMLCGCVPVVTRKGAIPEVVGNVGFYVPYDNPEKTAEAIKKALGAPENLSKRARKRIEKLFPIEKRGEKLLKMLDG